MAEEKQRIYTVVTLVALATLLFSCIAGALAGGLAGFIAGRRQGRAAVEQALVRELEHLPRLPEMPLLTPVPPDPPFEWPRGEEGAFVVEVIPGTPADAAGLEAGDIIIAIDRTPIDEFHRLADVIAQYEPADRVTIHFQRGRREDSVRVKLGKHPDEVGWPYLGVRYEMMAPGD